MASCRRGSCGVSDGICFVCKLWETLSVLTLPIGELCYCTVFCVLLWMWQSVCSSYCRQLNAVSFSTALHAALYRSMYSLLTRSSLRTLLGCLGAFAKFRAVTISFVMFDVPSVHLHGTTVLHCMDFHEFWYLSNLWSLSIVFKIH
jgi:hypothetical protein